MESENHITGSARKAEHFPNRVQKPPGGGHTDIFGVHDAPKEAPKTPARRRLEPKTTLGPSFFMSNDKNNVENKTSSVNDKISEDFKNENVETPDENQAPDDTNSNGHTEADGTNGIIITSNGTNGINTTSNATNGTTQQRRQRIPPGGFSSGLW